MKNPLKKLFGHDKDLQPREHFDRSLTKEHEEQRQIEARLKAIQVNIDIMSRGRRLRGN